MQACLCLELACTTVKWDKRSQQGGQSQFTVLFRCLRYSLIVRDHLRCFAIIRGVLFLCVVTPKPIVCHFDGRQPLAYLVVSSDRPSYDFEGYAI